MISDRRPCLYAHCNQPLPKDPWRILMGIGYTLQYRSSRNAGTTSGNVAHSHVETQIKTSILTNPDTRPPPILRKISETTTSIPNPTICTQKKAPIRNLISIAVIVVRSGCGGTSPMCTSPLKPNADTVTSMYLSLDLGSRCETSARARPGVLTTWRLI